MFANMFALINYIIQDFFLCHLSFHAILPSSGFDGSFLSDTALLLLCVCFKLYFVLMSPTEQLLSILSFVFFHPQAQKSIEFPHLWSDMRAPSQVRRKQFAWNRGSGREWRAGLQEAKMQDSLGASPHYQARELCSTVTSPTLWMLVL